MIKINLIYLKKYLINLDSYATSSLKTVRQYSIYSFMESLLLYSICYHNFMQLFSCTTY